jgi:hypothetical protein
MFVGSILQHLAEIMTCTTNTRGFLRNPKYELYAQNRVSGMGVKEASHKAGFKCKNGSYQLERNPQIVRRMRELKAQGAARVELSRKQILDRIFDDWNTSRQLGQMASALKAAELMGKEMFKMFVDRKEVGQPGDFDNKSEDELRQIIEQEMRELGWSDTNPPPSDPKLIN